MERNIDMGQTVEEAAHLFAESRSSGSAFPAYYQGFIAGKAIPVGKREGTIAGKSRHSLG